jgi:Protein of unknown function (DUF2924)
MGLGAITLFMPGSSVIPKSALRSGGRSYPASEDLSKRLAVLADLNPVALRAEWRRLYRSHPPKRINRDLLIRAIAYKLQEHLHGGLSNATKRKLRALAQQLDSREGTAFDPGLSLKPGVKLVREWGGKTHTVTVLEDGFAFEGERYPSLSRIAQEITGAHWSGPRFFRVKRAPKPFFKALEARNG